MQFTKSLPKQRTPVNSATNNMGQHYRNVRVPIKNYNTTQVAQRIDQQMSSLYVPLRLTYQEVEELIIKQQFDHLLKLLHFKTPVIENVYQERYNYQVNASGLGDFIRGSNFLMEFCDNNNIPYNINLLNHPVSQFLNIYINN